jgi:hypothetical protein
MPYCEDCKKYEPSIKPKRNDWEGRCKFYEVGTNALSDSCPKAERENWFIDPDLLDRSITPERRHTGGVNESEFFE